MKPLPAMAVKTYSCFAPGGVDEMNRTLRFLKWPVSPCLRLDDGGRVNV
jgi:hypothetical protein